MPNWCENRVYLEATPSEIEAIVAAVKNQGDTKGLLDYLRPQPEHAEESETHMPNWWSWRVENWGTKWEVTAEIVSHSIADGWINLAFDSAWSPPIEALIHWGSESEETRSYNIRYIEWGMGFCGEADDEGLNESFSIPLTVEAVEELIPVDIDEEFGISEMVAQWEEEEAEEEEIEHA
jgi:hypothetical protein